MCLYFFRFFTRWCLNLRFVFNTFWTKISECGYSDAAATAQTSALGCHSCCLPLVQAAAQAYTTRAVLSTVRVAGLCKLDPCSTTHSSLLPTRTIT